MVLKGPSFVGFGYLSTAGSLPVVAAQVRLGSAGLGRSGGRSGCLEQGEARRGQDRLELVRRELGHLLFTSLA